MTPRSYLYVPADQPEKLVRADRRGADAVILDLEDGVAPPAKASARTAAAEYLATRAAWVRINADDPAADIHAIAPAPALAGLVVPKAEPDLLARVDALLAGHPRVPVLALIETARGLRTLDAVASAPRVVRLGLGEADLAGELNLRPGPDREELHPIRSDVVVASAAARLAAPVGPVHTEVRDQKNLERTTNQLLRQGFRARTAITPSQVMIINEVFTPNPQEIATARDLLHRFEQAGSGVTVDAQGRLVDQATLRTAREVLTRAAANTARSPA